MNCLHTFTFLVIHSLVARSFDFADEKTLLVHRECAETMADGTPQEDRTLHVSNIAADVNEELLFELFLQVRILNLSSLYIDTTTPSCRRARCSKCR